LIFISLAAVIVLITGAVGVAFVMGGDDNPPTGPTAQGDCTVQTFAALGASHVEELPDDYDYNSIPATSGDHYPETAIWNLYDQPVPQIRYVHNLEHGGVVVQYGSEVSDADVAALRDWYAEDPRGLIVSPLDPELEKEDPALADQIVAVAWTHMLRCGSFEEDVLNDFNDDYRGPQGDNPEKFELDQLQQGGT
jgi:hypothetical protein